MEDPPLWFAKEQELMHDMVQLDQTTATTQVPTQLIKDLMRANKQATITLSLTAKCPQVYCF